MKWVLCYLNMNDYVTYKTDASLNAEYVQYKEFIKFIGPYVSKKHKDFYECLNRYQNIYIDIENKEWQVYRKQLEEPTFDVLLSLNQEREERKNSQKIKSKFGNTAIYKNIPGKYSIMGNSGGLNDKLNRDSESRTSIQAFFNKLRKG